VAHHVCGSELAVPRRRGWDGSGAPGGADPLSVGASDANRCRPCCDERSDPDALVVTPTSGLHPEFYGIPLVVVTLLLMERGFPYLAAALGLSGDQRNWQSRSCCWQR